MNNNTDINDVDLDLSNNESGNLTPLTSMDDMAIIVANWHFKVTGELEHMLQVPSGSDIEYTDEQSGETGKVTLEGEALTAFRLGIMTSLNAFNSLPFRAVPVPDSENATN